MVVGSAIVGALACISVRQYSGSLSKVQVHSDTSQWRELGGLGLFLLGAAVLLIGPLRAVRAKTNGMNNPLVALTFREQRRVIKTIRGHGDVRPEELTLLRMAASLMASQGQPMACLGVGGSLLTAGHLLQHGLSALGLGYALVVVVGFAFGIMLQRRKIRSARAFLAANPPIPPAELHPGRIEWGSDLGGNAAQQPTHPNDEY